MIGTSRWDALSWEEAKTYIRRNLAKRGTTVQDNDKDPMGDGDQSPISTKNAQFYRELFSAGGDMNHLADLGLVPLSDFSKYCISGDVQNVKQAFTAAAGEMDGPTPPDLVRLLETRETALRLSPLMMLISMGKNLAGPSSATDPGGMHDKQVQVAKLLLQYGARPDAKDVCGKTVCHYGMGVMATPMTLKIGAMCIEAHTSSHLFAKKVEVHGLKSSPHLNGAIGWCKGYLADNGRRSVYLIKDKKIMAVKPENLKLWKDGGGCSVSSTESIKLCDIPDRLKCVCLLEVIQGGRKDVAKILLHDFGARRDIEDVDGISPAKLSIGTAMLSPVAGMVNHAAAGDSREKRDVNRRTCANCERLRSDAGKLLDCGRCKSVAYCKKECQVAHWHAGHKKECKELAASRSQAIVLDPPRDDGTYSSTCNFKSFQKGVPIAEPQRGSSALCRPSNTQVGEQFYLKVQGNSALSPLMVYDKSRECNFSVSPGDTGFKEMWKAVTSEPTWQGRKTFIMAEFDAKGNCTVYPGLTSIKKW